jgi:hypothetical protein
MTEVTSNQEPITIGSEFRTFEQLPLDELRRQLAEENGTLQPENTDSAPIIDPDAPEPVAQQETAEQQNQPGVKVPVQALMSEREKRKTAQEEVDELRAELELIKQSIPQNQPQQAPAPQPPQVDYKRQFDVAIAEKTTEIETLEQQAQDLILELAAKKDDALITEVEYQKQVFDIQKKTRDGIRANEEVLNQLRARRNEPTPDEMKRIIESDPRIAEDTAKLSQANPWIENIPDAAFKAIEDIAAQRMMKEGVPIDASYASNMRYRELIVEVAAKDFGYDKLASNTPNQQQAPAPQAQTADNGIARELGSGKNPSIYQPPSLSNVGAPATPMGDEIKITHGFSNGNASAAMNEIVNSRPGQTFSAKIDDLRKELDGF